MVQQDENLTELPGIGKDLTDKIQEIVESEKLSQAEELEKRTDPGLRELLRLYPRALGLFLCRDGLPEHLKAAGQRCLVSFDSQLPRRQRIRRL